MVQVSRSDNIKYEVITMAVDSGATEHVANSASLFEILRNIAPIKIEVADGRELVSKKNGSIRIQLKSMDGEDNSGRILLLHVYFVPDLDM